ncbi:hypothetical protein pETSU_027 [Edwardsiella phage pEt-SU]|uniref:Uncharacterized protein n=1 Tax=Edwardsiella phage pEt-SU TaxID=2562142 RepID=A0A4D6DWK2_9CAUD|nr:hypothetical protein HOV39_gp027 [Edwardsiella phage pEt-SU]QBZ70608.1 hypothetical protein pETSU_027 [Edwardsiella phage pEt-SU]
MEQALQDVDHYARIVSGCESINHVLSGNGSLTEDGRYAQSVLKLRAQDEFGALAGNESLLEGIKKGARKLKEWVIALVKSIVGYLTGSTKKAKDVMARHADVEKNYNKLQADQKEKIEEKAKPAITAHGKVFERIIDKLTSLQEEGKSFSQIGHTVSMTDVIQEMKSALNMAEAGTWIAINVHLKRAVDRLNGQINSVKDKLNSYANGEETTERNSLASKAAAWENKAVAVSHSIVMNMDGITKKGEQWLDDFMTNKDTVLKL